MKLNMNDHATFRLTSYGAGIYNFHMRKNSLPRYRPAEKQAGDQLKMSLWELMQVFGPSLYMGGQIPFEENSIEVSEPISAKEASR